MNRLGLISRLRILQAGLSGLVLVLAVAFVLRPGTSPASNPGKSAEAQRALGDVRTHLNRVSLALMAYIQTRSAEQMERIKIEGQEANRRLGDYKVAIQNDPSKDIVQIDSRYETLRAATKAILAADTDQMEALAALDRNGQELERVFDRHILPSLRPNQISAYSKLRAAKEAETEARGLARNPRGRTWNAARFREALNTYSGLFRTGRSREWAEEAQTLFNRGVGQAKKADELDTAKKQLLSQYEQAYADLETSLSGAEDAGAVASSASSGRLSWPWLVSLVLGMILFGFGALAIDRTIQKQLIQPIQEIAQIADAAAAGDLSREINWWRRDEMGALGQSVNRILAVLSRSENLVYHLAALVESSGDAIISQSLDGTILSWNKGAQRIYGYSADEIKGQSITLLSPGDKGAALMAVLEKIQQGEVVQPFEAIHQAKEGRTVFLLVRVMAVFDSTKKVIGVSFCAQDLANPNLSPRRQISKESQAA